MKTLLTILSIVPFPLPCVLSSTFCLSTALKISHASYQIFSTLPLGLNELGRLQFNSLLCFAVTYKSHHFLRLGLQ